MHRHQCYGRGFWIWIDWDNVSKEILIIRCMWSVYVPVVLRGVQNHVDDCYICITKLAGLWNRKKIYILLFFSVKTCSSFYCRATRYIYFELWNQTEVASPDTNASMQECEAISLHSCSGPHLDIQVELYDLVRELRSSQNKGAASSFSASTMEFIANMCGNIILWKEERRHFKLFLDGWRFGVLQ